MKKGDAAEHARAPYERQPLGAWLDVPRPQTDATERTDNLADAALMNNHRPAGDGAATRRYRDEN